MGRITIRGLNDQLEAKPRARAAIHGRSMQQEVRNILREALAKPAASKRNLADAIRSHIELVGGVELSLPPRKAVCAPAKLES